jgi:(p)ppGpp synthase/HD superfamily hydrolase
VFSSRIERALAASLSAHSGQFRKGDGDMPYVVHPMHVAVMLARWGQEEDIIVAGLLHDAVEDSQAWTLERVESEFGHHVAGIVGQLTENKTLAWDERKRAGVEHVRHMSPEAATVKAADKLHNLQTLRAQLATEDPDEVWCHFTGGRERTLALDRELVEALCQRVEPRIARALRAAYQALLDQDALGRGVRPGV